MKVEMRHLTYYMRLQYGIHVWAKKFCDATNVLVCVWQERAETAETIPIIIKFATHLPSYASQCHCTQPNTHTLCHTRTLQTFVLRCRRIHGTRLTCVSHKTATRARSHSINFTSCGCSAACTILAAPKHTPLQHSRTHHGCQHRPPYYIKCDCCRRRRQRRRHRLCATIDGRACVRGIGEAPSRRESSWLAMVCSREEAITRNVIRLLRFFTSFRLKI